MIRLLFSFFFIWISLDAGELHLTLESVSGKGSTGQIRTAKVESGVSGFVVRHFSPEHSAVIANAVATGYDEASGLLTVSFSAYSGLRQNSLPRGNWRPGAGDEVVLAFAYARGILVAPGRQIYNTLTDKITTVEWMHPDTLATFLSYRGHPTPLKEDFAAFCSNATTGLLFLYIDDALLTLDCQSLGLLQISPAGLAYETPQLPFYSRVGTIDAGWFGEGSSTIENYDAYYLQLLVENNPNSQKLYDFIQSHPSADRQLLEEFDLKGQR